MFCALKEQAFGTRYGRKADIEVGRSRPLSGPPFESKVCDVYRGKFTCRTRALGIETKAKCRGRRRACIFSVLLDSFYCFSPKSESKRAGIKIWPTVHVLDNHISFFRDSTVLLYHLSLSHASIFGCSYESDYLCQLNIAFQLVFK